MDIPCFIGCADLFWINFIKPIGLTNLRKNIVIEPLERIAHVAILFHLPIELIKIIINETEGCCSCKSSHFSMLRSIENVGLCSSLEARLHEDLFHCILKFLHSRDMMCWVASDFLQDIRDHLICQLLSLFRIELPCRFAGSSNGASDLLLFKTNLFSISFNNFCEHGENNY